MTTPTDGSDGGLDRRQFLALILAAIGTAAAGLAPADTTRAAATAGPWLATLADRGAAARLGAAYLAAYPQEQDPARLAAALGEATGLAPGADPPLPEVLLARLDERVRGDYVGGRTLIVARWLISRTEARLYAVAALA